MHAEVGREVDDQLRVGRGDRVDHPRRFTVLEREEDDVAAARRLAGRDVFEGRVTQDRESGVDIGQRFPGLAAAHREAVVDLGMLQQ